MNLREQVEQLREEWLKLATVAWGNDLFGWPMSAYDFDETIATLLALPEPPDPELLANLKAWVKHSRNAMSLHVSIPLPAVEQIISLIDALAASPKGTQEPQCTGPFSDARDCPVHRPSPPGETQTSQEKKS